MRQSHSGKATEHSDEVAIMRKIRKKLREERLLRRHVQFLRFLKSLCEEREKKGEVLKKLGQMKTDWRKHLSKCAGIYAPALPSKGQLIRLHPSRYALSEWVLELSDGLQVPFIVLSPESAMKPFANIVLIPPLGERTGLGCRKEDVSERYGVLIADAGYRVIIPDLPTLASSNISGVKWLILSGKTFVGEMARELMSLTTFLINHGRFSELPIAIMGWGISGWAGLIFAALDERVCGAFISMPPRMTIHGYVPGMFRKFTFNSVGALVSPRVLAFSSTLEDCLEVEGDIIKATYEAENAEEMYRRLALSQPEDLVKWFTEEGSLWAQNLLQRYHLKNAGKTAPIFVAEAHEAPCDISKIKSAEEWENVCGKLRRSFVELLGMDGEKSEPEGIIDQLWQEEGIIHERIIYKSENFAKVSAVMLKGCEGKKPTVICIPGSSQSVEDMAKIIGKDLAKIGIHSFIVDPKPGRFSRIAVDEFMDGKPMLGQMAQDVIAGIDYLQTREDVDANSIGCFGISMGGTLAWIAAAIDERIKVAACALCFSTFGKLKESVRDERIDGSFLSFLDSHGEYYFVPGILRLGEQDAFIAMIAPRPLLLLAATRDNCFPFDGAKEVYERVKRIYELYGANEKLAFEYADAPHSFTDEFRIATLRWFSMWM